LENELIGAHISPYLLLKLWIESGFFHCKVTFPGTSSLIEIDRNAEPGMACIETQARTCSSGCVKHIYRPDKEQGKYGLLAYSPDDMRLALPNCWRTL